MKKYVEVNAAKEFAGTFLGDPIMKMTVNAVLDHAPAADVSKLASAEMGCNMAGTGYRNGEESMREKVIAYLTDQKGIALGAVRSTLSDAIEKVRKL